MTHDLINAWIIKAKRQQRRDPMFNVNCQCDDCRDFYADRRSQISHELAEMHRDSGPGAEAIRSSLIAELTELSSGRPH